MLLKFSIINVCSADPDRSSFPLKFSVITLYIQTYYAEQAIDSSIAEQKIPKLLCTLSPLTQQNPENREKLRLGLRNTRVKHLVPPARRVPLPTPNSGTPSFVRENPIMSVFRLLRKGQTLNKHN